LGQGQPWFIKFDSYFAGRQVESEERDRRAAQVGSVIVWALENRIAERASSGSEISLEWTGSGNHHIIVRDCSCTNDKDTAPFTLADMMKQRLRNREDSREITQSQRRSG